MAERRKFVGMSEQDLLRLMAQNEVKSWRLGAARWVESGPVQNLIISVIILNGIILGLQTDAGMMATIGPALIFLDALCLFVFSVEIAFKLAVYRGLYWSNGWNLFDFFVVAIALVPGVGAWSVLRSLRILRVFRLISALPQLRRVVTALIQAVPGLSGVILLLVVFFYTMAVLSTNLFGGAFPHWFGSIGESLFSLFQIMTLESWSMGIVRPVMEVFPWAWAFFVPFIVIATFTILNLFIGIIVSTMQELAALPDPSRPAPEIMDTLQRVETELAELRRKLSEGKGDQTPKRAKHA